MKITTAQLRQLIKEAVYKGLREGAYEPPNWDDYFSSDRESGHEGMMDVILSKLEEGEPLSKDELQALKSELSGDRHLAGLKHSSGEF